MSEKKQKVRKLSFRMKLLLPTFAVIIVLCASISVYDYFSTKAQLTQMGAEQAAAAGKVAAASIDGEMIKSITFGSETTPEYEILLADLREVRERCGILYMYTLFHDDTTVYYGVDTDTGELQGLPGDEFETLLEDLIGVFNGTPMLNNYIDHQIYGDVISVYYPIYDSQGNVAAIIGNDYDATIITERIHSALLKFILLTVFEILIGCLILFGLFFLLLRNMNIVNKAERSNL